MPVLAAQLHHLANLFGIRTSYLDMNGNPCQASGEALLAVLKSMGAPIETTADAASAIKEKEKENWQQPIEPVIVVWENEIPTVNLRIQEVKVESSISARLKMESGEQKELEWRRDLTSIIDSTDVEGTPYVTLRWLLPEKLPFGYHRLELESAGKNCEALIISAPLKAHTPPLAEEKIWGVFVPAYALHTRKSWGAGDFSDIQTLSEWVCGLGGRMVGMLPLLPSFFDSTWGPGPYTPASRLFWNEFYLDIDLIPELKQCPEATTLMNSPGFQEEIGALRSAHAVDYGRQFSLKRRVLEELAEYLFREKPPRLLELQHFIEADRSTENYARFRAAGEQQGIDWHKWPDRMRNGILEKGDYAEKNYQYHLYSQWCAQKQVRDLTEKSKKNNLYLYLDLPIGVHPYGYDVWSEREVFVPGVNAGAPPDPVFTSGQNWSFPTLHPQKIRQQGYRYMIDSLQHQLKCAGMLRIDHMMNFHRLFWIPEGMENRDGVYVNYHADELYAIVALESSRNEAVIIGEDLGIVPPEVRPMMEKHGIFRMYVGQYELISENQLGKIPSRATASLNTHDMFPFAAFWQENDITERQKLKLLDAKSAQKELEERRNVKRNLISILQYKGLYNEISTDTEALLKAILNLLAGSPAYALLVNLEDLWLETHPQNVPGTQRNQNWSRKAHYSFEEFSKSPRVLEMLTEIDRVRRKAGIQP